MAPRPAQALTPDSPIPEKLYFKIGEVAQLVGVETHVLRYWEREVPTIRPGKSVSNQRRYRRKDVEIFREIRRLLHTDRYTLAGARRQLSMPDGLPPPSVIAPSAAPAARDVEVELPELEVKPPIQQGSSAEKLARVKAGLNDLIRLAGEEP